MSARSRATELLTAVNLALRFLLELLGVASLAYWGFNATDHPLGRVALAVGAAVVLIAIWSRVFAARTRSGLSTTAKIAGGGPVLLVAAAALLAAGHATLASIYALLVVVNTLLLLRLGGGAEHQL